MMLPHPIHPTVSNSQLTCMGIFQPQETTKLIFKETPCLYKSLLFPCEKTTNAKATRLYRTTYLLQLLFIGGQEIRNYFFDNE